jgi:hypothetical protein
MNVAFYREQPSQRHVHRLTRPEAAVLAGLAGLERDVRPRPKCRARGRRHPGPADGAGRPGDYRPAEEDWRMLEAVAARSLQGG